MFWYKQTTYYKVEMLDDNPNPETLEESRVYVVGNDHYSKWGYLVCPCGCKSIIMLSLNTDNFPAWIIEKDKLGRASIYPSINKLDGCQSHFILNKGKIFWLNGY